MRRSEGIFQKNVGSSFQVEPEVREHHPGVGNLEDEKNQRLSVQICGKNSHLIILSKKRK